MSLEPIITEGTTILGTFASETYPEHKKQAVILSKAVKSAIGTSADTVNIDSTSETAPVTSNIKGLLARAASILTSLVNIEESAANIEVLANLQATTDAKAEEEITVDNTVGGVALTAATYGTSRKAQIQVQDAQIRYSFVIAPTATSGKIANHMDPIPIDSNADIASFRAIRTGSTSAKLHVTYSDVVS